MGLVQAHTRIILTHLPLHLEDLNLEIRTGLIKITLSYWSNSIVEKYICIVFSMDTENLDTWYQGGVGRRFNSRFDPVIWIFEGRSVLFKTI